MTPQQLQAMKMALEALKNNKLTHLYCEDTWYSCPKHKDGCANEAEGDECNCGADDVNAQFDQAITAIEEALAQPEQCKYPECKCPTENPCLKGLAQPEQEPKRTGMVYYKNDACQAKDAYSHDCICWTKAQPEQEPVIDKSAAKRIATSLGWEPKRKPLTSKQIREWWASENGFEDCDMTKLDDFTQVVRGVEGKHGIKENT